MASLYSVNLTPFKHSGELKEEWLDLEQRADCPFFLSWTWISSWLEVNAPCCHILRVSFDGQLVGLGLITRSDLSAFNRFPSSRIHLHQMGNTTQDQVWTEYNGFLYDSEHRSQSIKAGLNFLQSSFPAWDELVIGAITKSEAGFIEMHSGLERHDLWQSATFGVNLKQLAEKQTDYLSSLSRNTRYQIRRSIKRYEKQGGLTLSYASSCSQALEYLNEVAPFHLNRWGSSVEGSGFANSNFVQFHQTLIKNAWGENQIDFIKLTCKDRVVGYFYNFKYRGKVYFYLSGLVKENDPCLKPGLSGHALSIQRYIDDDYQYYDFMGGNERYKASLGDKHDDLFQVAYQKPRLKFKAEHLLRYIKKRIIK